MKTSKKFIVEFDKKPALIFVSQDGANFTVYQDGKELKGVKSISIHAAFDSPTTHEIEFATGCTE